MNPRWKRYRRPRGFESREGVYLVQLRNRQILLGEFYCDEFVVNGRGYNQTPGLLEQITHLQLVEPR